MITPAMNVDGRWRIGGMLVKLTKDELFIINNTLNEVCNGIESFNERYPDG